MATDATDDSRPEPEAVVSFGFRDVPLAEKPALVRGVFASVARRYDLMNDLMSLGVHRIWKRILASMIPIGATSDGATRLLDVAGGTGDIACRFLDTRDGKAPVAGTVCDLTWDMVRAGRDRALDRGRTQGVSWVVGDAQALPFSDRAVDVVTIAFGLRNVAVIPAALREMRRVLKPGGIFLCLEFSPEVLPLLRRAYDLYSFSVLPRLGAVVAGDADSYVYLVESIRRFPDRDTLSGLLGDAGFERVRSQGLSGGIAAIHQGWRL